MGYFQELRFNYQISELCQLRAHLRIRRQRLVSFRPKLLKFGRY